MAKKTWGTARSVLARATIFKTLDEATAEINRLESPAPRR